MKNMTLDDFEAQTDDMGDVLDAEQAVGRMYAALDAREQKVLEGLAAGLTVKEIAASIGLVASVRVREIITTVRQKAREAICYTTIPTA